MSGVVKIEIIESTQTLKKLLGQVSTSQARERVQALYWLKTKTVNTVCEIAALLGRNRVEEDDLIYFVTKQGGKLWESVSQPKWNQYFRRNNDEWESLSTEIWDLYISRKSRIVCGADREIIKKIISIEHLLEHPQFIRYPIAGTEIWQTFTPWHPVYWKTLPCGYLVSYQVKLVEVDESVENTNESPELIEQIKQAEEWYLDIVNWHTDYFTKNDD